MLYGSEQLYTELVATLRRKAADYAADDNVLKNFRTVGAAIRLFGINPQTDIGYAFVMLLVKVQRLCNLIFTDKEPQNESIDDSFKDLLGYIFLIYAIYTEDYRGV